MLVNRRQFLQTGLGTLALAVVPPKAETRIGIALIGLGDQGKRILRKLLVLSQSHPIEIVGLCDVQASALEQTSDWIPQARQTQDYQTVLGWEDVQAVVIATPDITHNHLAQAVLSAGLDLYLEPPLARNSLEAENLIRLAEDRGCIVQLGIYQFRHSGYTAAREIITSGKLGKVSRIEVSVSPESLSEPPLWQLSNELSDGQAALVLTQVFEVIRYILGVSLPVQVAAQGGVYLSHDERTNPDTLHVLLNYPEGFLFNFSMGLGKLSFNIYGTHGTLDLVNWQAIPKDTAPFSLLEGNSRQFEDTLQPHLADWLTCIREHRTPALPIQAGYDQVRLIEKIRE
jgi:predicted dehydrogenase